MATRLTEEKTPKQQSIEQALRRLKYLHTSLLPHETDKMKRQSEHNFDKVLRTKGLQPACEERSTADSRRTPEKQLFYSLEPNTARKHREMGKTRVAKYKQNKKVIRTGRAPLRSTTYVGTPFSPTVEKEQFKRKRNSVETFKKRTERVSGSKSASGISCTVESYKCVQCFANDFERAHKKQATKKYCTNMKINRVTFSARPSGSNAKPTCEESKIAVAKSSFYNGWGVRSKTESLTTGKNGSKYQAMDAMDVTAGLKTLKLDTWTERMRQRCNEETIPQPPPTPVRQIDIKLPQGMVVKYQLSEDE